MFFGKKKKNRQTETDEQPFLRATPVNTKSKDYFGLQNKNEIDLITSNGIDATNPEYIIIYDAGIPVYGAGLYIDKLPRSLDIAVHFSALYNYPGVTPSTFIDPMLEESKTAINKRINMLDGEIYGAEKADNSRNRLRELHGKMQNAEKWASRLDSGENTLYRVAFLFWVIASSPEELRGRVADFEGVAKKKGFELLSCYGAHLEAFLSSYPLNRTFAVEYDKSGVKKLLRHSIIKWHIMDKRSLSTIYNHTTAEFSHREGVPMGRNLFTGLPICFDPFDSVHTSYGMVVAGMPGYGKSATLKSLYSRLIEFGYYFALVDYEPLPSGRCGEYTAMVNFCGGVSYTISNKGGNRLNLFELNEELEYDRATDSEYRTLHLADKVVDLTNILLAMATSITVTRKDSVFPAETLARMSAIISKIVKELFEERGIREGEPDSLWQQAALSESSFASGRIRKALPTMHDFYMKLIIHSSKNNDRFKEDSFSLLLDVFEDMVEELYYNPVTFEEYTREEYLAIPPNNRGERYKLLKDGSVTEIRAIRGSKAYFDCQSNVQMDLNLPMVSFDISQVPESERPIMMLVCQNFIEENFIKLNSANPKAARRLIFSEDEAHKALPYEGARSYLNALYRTARKRHVAPVLIMQSIADLSRYADTEDILKNTETFLLFKHSYADRDFIKKTTNLSDSQVDTILNLGGNPQSEKKRPGELAIIEVPTKKTVFVYADYLKDSERQIVETDAEEIAKMYAGRGGTA